MVGTIGSLQKEVALEREGKDNRYSLLRESNGTWSLVDQYVAEADRDPRIVTGLLENQGAELVRQLNSRSKCNR